MSKQIKKMIQEIDQLMKDYQSDNRFDFHAMSRKQLLWIHYLIKMGERIGVPLQDTTKSMPHTFSPGCDINLVELPDWITEMDKKTIQASLCCSLCNSLPYIMKECQNCGYIYCWSCFNYLANLYVFCKKITRPAKPILCPFVCLNDACWMCQDLTPPMIVNPSRDRIQLIDQIVYACNQAGCSFMAKWLVMVHHVKYHQDRNETNFRIPDASLPLIYHSLGDLDDQNDEDVQIICPPNEVKVEVIDLDEDDNKPIVIVADEAKIEINMGGEKPAINIPSQQSAINNVITDVEGDNQHFQTNRLCAYNRKSLAIEAAINPTRSLQDTFCTPFEREELESQLRAKNLKPKSNLKLTTVNQEQSQATVWNMNRFKRKSVNLNGIIQRAMVTKNFDGRLKFAENLRQAQSTSPESKVYKKQQQKLRALRRVASVKQFCPPLHIEREDTPAWSMVMNSVQFIRENKLKVISLDIVGQTLRIGGHIFGVPGSIGMMTTDGIVLCDLLRYPKNLLLNPDNENIITGLKFEHIKYCANFTLVRSKAIEYLLEADVIVIHGQVNLLQRLNFTRRDYYSIRHKIRDIGAYYNCHKMSPTLSLQFATYLIFGEPIHGRKKHYAIHNAYFILCLYLADRERIEKTYEQAKSNVVYGENGWPVIQYPLNSQICGLLRKHMDVFGDWPQEIKETPFGQKVFKPNWDHYVDPAKDLHPPYTNPRNLYEKFFSNSPERANKKPRTQ